MKINKVQFFLFLILLGTYISSKAQGDCPAQFVCVGGAFTAVVDVTDELNGINNGCLAVNEGTTSYWYQICVSTGGTIRFTIAPQGNNNDYDWAVWSGNTCPPTTTPIRCSFAISQPGNDNTGVNSNNNAPQTDLTEGVGGNQWTQDINALANNCYIICVNNYGAGSNNFNLTFGGTATLSCIPLAIELWYFNGEITEDNYNLIKWSTITEIENDYFNIERSTNGNIWENIAKVNGAGNSNITQYYSYEDKNFTGNTNNYYRLKIFDFNGNYEYSNIISFNNQQIKPNKMLLKRYNQLGQEVDEYYKGFVIELYDDGSNIKTIR
jgi:hypothetical protein